MIEPLPPLYGFNKSSEAGEDVFAYSVFVSGCNFCCPYCMNKKLVLGDLPDPIPIEKIFQSIEEEKPDKVIISGGEPTMYAPLLLSNLIDEFKKRNCKVGLSTNGSNPSCLKEIIGKLDSVYMDIKTSSFPIYRSIINDSNFQRKPKPERFLIDSKYILRDEKFRRDSSFEYEIRTTLYPPFFENIKRDIERFKFLYLIGRDEKWVLQYFSLPGKKPPSFREGMNCLIQTYSNY